MPEYADRITGPPSVSRRRGSGFWVVSATVGFAALPLGSPDYLNQLLYTPVVPVGRTVNAAMTDADKAEATACSDAAFAVDVARATCPSASPIPPTTNHFRPA